MREKLDHYSPPIGHESPEAHAKDLIVILVYHENDRSNMRKKPDYHSTWNPNRYNIKREAFSGLTLFRRLGYVGLRRWEFQLSASSLVNPGRAVIEVQAARGTVFTPVDAASYSV